MHHRALQQLIVLLLALPTAAAAQWQAGLGVGIVGYGRWVVSAPNTVASGPDGRPTTTWPVEADLSFGGAGRRAGVRLSRSRPGLELYDATLQVALRPAFEVLRLTPELSLPVVAFSRGGQLRLGVGLPVERWSFPDFADPPRWRVGASANTTLELPLGRRTSVRLSGSVGALFRHPFAGTEPIEGYQPTRTWRRGLGIGVGWEL